MCLEAVSTKRYPHSTLPLGRVSSPMPFTQLTNDLIQFKVSEPNHFWRKLEQKNPLPPRESHVGVSLNDKTILIYGGNNADEASLDDFWLLDVETVTWHEVTEIKGIFDPKFGCTMTLFPN